MSIKSQLTSQVERLFRKAGYEITPMWRHQTRPLVEHLRALFNHYDIDCVFDVGANLGQYHDLLRDQVGFTGLIISFEPVRQYAELLRSRAANEPNWVICDFALGSTATLQQINVSASPGLSSFLRPRKDLVEGFWSDDSFTEIQTIQIKRLDDVLSDLCRQHPFNAPYLKVDTQGFDLEVLKGAAEALASKVFRGMQTEASVRSIYEGAPTYEVVIAHLNTLGFDLSGLFPVLYDQSYRLIEFDCILVNRAFAATSSAAT